MAGFFVKEFAKTTSANASAGSGTVGWRASTGSATMLQRVQQPLVELVEPIEGRQVHKSGAFPRPNFA